MKKKYLKFIKDIHLKRDSLIYLLKDFDGYGCGSKGARPQPRGATVPWPLGAIALCLLKAKRQRAGCLSSGPGRAFLGASPRLHPRGRASITTIPFRVGGRCTVTASPHPPSRAFQGQAGSLSYFPTSALLPAP